MTKVTEEISTVPLSLGQEAMWVQHKLADTAVYNNHFVWELPPDIDLQTLRQTICCLTARHLALRATYHFAGGAVMLTDNPDYAGEIREQRIDDLEDDQLKAVLDRELNCRFNLSEQPVVYWKLFRRKTLAPVFGLFMQHTNIDLWSCMVVLNELRDVFSHISATGEPPKARVSCNLSQYNAWQRKYPDTEGSVGEKNYWNKALQSASFALNLPTDYPPQDKLGCRGEYYQFFLDQQAVDKLHQVAKSQGVSLFAIWFSLYHLLLHRLTQQEDIAVGTAVGGRTEQFGKTFGYLSNSLVIRHIHHTSGTFIDYLLEFNQAIDKGLQHQLYPYSQVIKNLGDSLGTPKNFQTIFVWENINRFENRDEAFVHLDDNGRQIWDFKKAGTWKRLTRKQQLDDMQLVFRLNKFKERLLGAIDYNTDLFKLETIRRFAEIFNNLLAQVAEDPGIPLAQLSLLPDNEREKIAYRWNDTTEFFSLADSFPDSFARNVLRTPEKTALVHGRSTYTYAAVNERANLVAQSLLAQHLQAENIVGVFLDRSADAVIAILGIMKAGGAYLPLDPDYPPERLKYIIEDARPAFIISDRKLQNRIPANSAETQLFFMERAVEDSRTPTQALPTIKPSQLAYVIYTSGSTGKPKGTLIEHSGLIAQIHAQAKTFGIDQDDNILQFASLNFDASIYEIVAALHNGATLHVGNRKELLGDNLLRFLKQHEISWCLIPPALLSVLTPEDLPRLKTLIVGGDACSQELAKKWSVGRNFYNAYGPTESTIVATIAKVDGSTPPPIGKPIANTQTYILDPNLHPQPIGIPGELHIGGACLARGYLNRPDLTSAKFISNPFNQDPRAKLYKTGDLCRYREDGNIEFLGRIDHQVKIRGFRVELGEIESVLREHPKVHDVLVMARNDLPSSDETSQQLAAYVVKKADATLDIEALRSFLKNRLPDYMVPAGFVVLDAFPMTPNEKIDRKALPIPEAGTDRSRAFKPPRNAIERQIAEVWQQCLGITEVSVVENFFDLGGHSLLLAQIHNLLPEHLREELEMVDLFHYPTIQSLASHLESNLEEETDFIEHDDHAERLNLRRRQMESLGEVRIAIVGMAGRFPGAETVNEFWDNICQKTESISFFSPEQLRAARVPESLYVQPNYVPAKGILRSISEFDANFFNFTPREAEITDPQQRVFLECAWEALEDAGCVVSDFDGRIGVYAGIGLNRYLMSNLSPHTDLIAAVGDYLLTIGNDKDFLSSRVAYKLNLDGPAMVLQTACSTSLVAVHTACQALLNEDCDAALAGGVSFGRLNKTGYLYQEGMIMSKDGHCRAFDAEASGTVPGQGCGVVVLKRLDDALQNNDHIYAIISGSGTNNDGSNKTGYTAPSIEGQAKAIKMAQASANISASQVSYVEAHGTGTSIGDPIEMEGLQQAFKTNGNTGKTGSCAIGAVKTNIGHLDAAAGIAGLIKTAKALEMKKLPPSLNFSTLNPQIKLRKSPFYINTELTDWETNDSHRFAGVSSFGMGGTNAHVILTDAPSQIRSRSYRPWNIVLLSARSKTALEKMTERLVNHLKTHKKQSFANICFTLHSGREVFPYRRHLVCKNRAEAIANLSPVNPRHVNTSHYVDRAHKIIFMFSGQGSQYKNMGQFLYRVEKPFRESIDLCRNMLKNKFIQIFEELSSEDIHGFTDKLHQTYITQPALFIFEYALAKMLISWGLKPDLMIGHSLGEFVAACLAGVFTLDQALELVTIRGYLIQGLAAGDMLSVNLPEEDAALLTHHDVSLAAVNGARRCVLSGSGKAIQYLHNLLDERGVDNRILHTSHAFHSHMMDPILERFRGYVARRQPQAPQIPFISSVSGKSITPEQAQSPDYWVQHLRQTVRFHDGLNSIFSNAEQDEACFCLEIGPGKVLSSLANQHPAKRAQDWISPTVHHAYEDISDTEFLLKVIGRLWEQGVKIDWDAFHKDRQHYRVPLPTYPFERKRYWVSSQVAESGVAELTPQPTDIPVAEEKQAEEQQEGMVENPGVEPTNAIERAVKEIWQLLLGRKDFSIYDDFFELGGDSLMAVSIVGQLNERFKVPLGSHVLMKHPTVSGLADYLAANGVDSKSTQRDKPPMPDSCLIRIQEGNDTRLPLFMVHPIGGEVIFYRDLAHQLGKDQPLFAFQAPSLSGAKPIDSIYRLAETYNAEMQRKNFEPPYLLGGSSFGGLVALEMARQLSFQGLEVKLIVMVDTPAPHEMPTNLQDSAAILHYLLEDKLALSLEKLRELDEESQINYVLEEARVQNKASVIPPHLGQTLFQTWLAHQRATVRYHPEPYEGDVVYFRHTEPLRDFPAMPHLAWKPLIQGSFSVYQIPGNHVTMNYPPHVKVLANHLKPVIAEIMAIS